ncbi:hypothetical protein Btru_009829 [Bulinus truncatus]|nr:hypothetical protein Btru_009829 [Bulinus truncatus]
MGLSTQESVSALYGGQTTDPREVGTMCGECPLRDPPSRREGEGEVDDIETKIDLLVDMYKEDRKLLLQHLHQSCPVPGSGSDQPPPPPSASTTTTSNAPQFKPRPILVEKQFTSEPATPTALNFPGSYGGGGGGRGKPIIQRNLSDLSQRIKKRVTYHPLSLHDPPSRAQSAASFTNSVAMSSIFSNTSDNQSFQQSLAHTPPSDVPPVVPDRCLQSDDQPEREVAIDGTPSAEPQSSLKPRDFQPHKLLHQPSSISLPPISSTTLSTLSEQRSVESDSSLSCGELGQGSSLSPTVNSSASSEQTLPPTSLLLASANQLKESHCCHGDRRSSALFPPASAQTTSTTEDMSESDRQDLLHNITV